jgi:FAD/FMN-containing dehydrogenase
MTSSLALLQADLVSIVGEANVISSGDTLDTLSKDYYWYSPSLRAQLDEKRADLVVRPATTAQVRAVIVACFAANVAITPRGAGTGNYGQCMPLHGGVVIDLSRYDRIHTVEGGVVRADSGARLGAIETVARATGWELRCYPSTWMKATLGGFFGGGAGGIGGVRWGGIAAIDTVVSITILTIEAEPRTIRCEGHEAMVALRTFGTTGIMTEIEMRLAPKLDYDQLAFSSPDWAKLLDWTDAATRNGVWRKRVASQFQWPIPSFFKPIRKHLRDNEHVSFLLIDRAQTSEVAAAAEALGIACVYNRPLADPPKPPFLSDFTYNHTTLWAMKSEPAYTYVQAGFGADFRNQISRLTSEFPGEILMHLEWGAIDPKRVVGPDSSPDAIGVGAIPLILYKNEARFIEIIAFARSIGISVGNTHNVHLPDSTPEITAARLALKHQVDPRGLQNPGKMKAFPINPFSGAAG